MRSEREGASAHSSSGLDSGALEEMGAPAATGDPPETSTLEELEAGELEEEAGLVKSFPLTNTDRKREAKEAEKSSEGE